MDAEIHQNSDESMLVSAPPWAVVRPIPVHRGTGRLLVLSDAHRLSCLLHRPIEVGEFQLPFRLVTFLAGQAHRPMPRRDVAMRAKTMVASENNSHRRSFRARSEGIMGEKAAEEIQEAITP